jgi:hypothetical protein
VQPRRLASRQSADAPPPSVIGGLQGRVTTRVVLTCLMPALETGGTGRCRV